MRTMFTIGKILRDHGKLLMSDDTAEFSVVTCESPRSGHAYETAVRYKRITVDGREWNIFDSYDDAEVAVVGHNRLVAMLARAG